MVLVQEVYLARWQKSLLPLQMKNRYLSPLKAHLLYDDGVPLLIGFEDTLWGGSKKDRELLDGRWGNVMIPTPDSISIEKMNGMLWLIIIIRPLSSR